MIVCISPAKNMRESTSPYPLSVPYFKQMSLKLLNTLKNKSISELMAIFECNEKIAILNKERYTNLAFDDMGTAAFLTYNGMQFKAMQHYHLDDNDLAYANEHVRIISGFYGYLKPFDSIYPYRLDMGAKLLVNDTTSVYEFWNNQIIKQLRKELSTHTDKHIIDLCSKEYSHAINQYINKNDQYVNISFFICKKGKLKCEATQAKVARGLMVHGILHNRIKTIEQLKQYHDGGYKYSKKLSTDQELVFINIIEDNHVI